MSGVQVVIWLLTALAVLQGAVLVVLWMRGDARHEVLQSQTDWLQNQMEELAVKADEPTRLRKPGQPTSSKEILARHNDALRQENAMLRVERMRAWRAAQKVRKRLEAIQPPETEVNADTQE